MNYHEHHKTIADKGYAIISNVFSEKEIEQLSETISKIDSSNETFRKS